MQASGLLLLLLTSSSCFLPIHRSKAQGWAGPLADSVVFAVVAQTFMTIGDSAPVLRVDPPPLISDPTLVSFAKLGSLAPPGVTGHLTTASFIADTLLVNARRRSLGRLSVLPTDVFDDLRCDAQRSANPLCVPTNGFSTLVVGLPRPGGPYSPGIIDAREEFSGRDVFSVRVIERTVTRLGSAEFSADYVYEREAGGRIVFLKRARLFSLG